MKTYEEMAIANVNQFKKEIQTLFKSFPESYNAGFVYPWKEHFERIEKESINGILMEYRHLSGLHKKYPEDEKLGRSIEIFKEILNANLKLLEDYPLRFTFKKNITEWTPWQKKGKVDNINQIQEYFFTDEAFAPYSKGCCNLMEPNVYENIIFEVGRYDKRKKAWVRTGLNKATHIGCYFDSSYLNSKFIRKDDIEMIFERDCSSHRRHHIFKFVIKPIQFEIRLTEIEQVKKGVKLHHLDDLGLF